MANFDGSAGSPFVNQILHDRYQIQALLGRKPGRQTFLALDLKNQLPVVIKLLLFSPDFTWEDLKLFEREAETLKALNHPAIPQYLDFFEVEIEFGKGFALVQGYIEARSLQQLIQDGCRFSEAELTAIAKDLLDILEYLYRLQPPVIHRDIKPSNVLLKNRSGNSPGEVYLIDFGSVQTAAHSGTVTVVGTYGYMPPEQFGGRSLPASDLYGVGMTLIYLATGQHPADLPQNDLHVEFKHLTSLSGSFISWIEWLTDPSLTQRPATAQDARLHFLKPPQEPKAALTLPKKHLGITTRPSSSIFLKATQTTLQLELPLKQIQYTFSGKILNKFLNKYSDRERSLIMWACLAVISITVCALIFIDWFLALLLLPMLILSFSRFLPILQDTDGGEAVDMSFESARSLPIASANVTFQKKDKVVIVTLNLLKSVEPTEIFQGRLMSISAGEDVPTRYRLNLNFPADDQIIVVDGDRQEIGWLCNELSEWTGIRAKPWRNLQSRLNG
ncbi:MULTISPECIES: serine/threonine-protein kinase [Cyanophyceae]|uniref:serine/threonine protein kinase n=1 Tax=Cyanophyceae TaxID=3028117 RepID=UPI001686B9A6|nr:MULTISPECIES: serine/threonine-protein kinase [Cyanophyceae]MBD1917684.1 serine/threonine protein kinase [Phormidium sp. FACHB-77]MBD2031152.1 serine/threonine protein kinase [Phormidium sp. FACHB-322]MBD2053581.1 serine/threonine protein kinase [Leptolyngbya sp. FACHB-60]